MTHLQYMKGWGWGGWGGACFSALVVQASPLTLVLKYRLHLFPARSVFKHHQTSLMSRLGGTGSAFR